MSTINGSNANDTLTGGSQADVINGGNGNDTLSGGGGNDTLSGGNGSDVIFGGDGADTIDGGNDNDTIDGGTGNDTILGGNGSDHIMGGDGADTIDGGNDNDTIDGGTGNDTILGGNGNDQIAGGDGADTIDGGNGDDVLDGGAGADHVIAGNGDDIVIHHASENVGSSNVYEGGNGRDTLRLYVSSAVVNSAAFQADLAHFNAVAGSSGSGVFNSLNFTYSSFEKIEIILEGNTNHAPTDIALTGNTVAENAAGAVVGTLSTVDPDAGNTHTYTVSDSRFEVVGSTLKLKDGVSLNFEAASSVSVNVTTTDNGGLSFTEAFAINVTNVNEAPTDIALNGNTVAENAAGAVIGTLSTVDPDVGNTHTYTVSDSRFEAVGDTLKLKAGQSLDFENGSSVSVNVTSTDAGGLSRTEAFTINVTNVNEAPTDIALTGNTVAENAAGAVIGTLSTVDPDVGNTHTYTVSDSRFEAVGDTLKLKAGQSLDFEHGSSVSVNVTSTDAGGLSRTEAFTINVTNVNEAPTDIALTGNTVAENAAGAVIGTLSTVDPDVGNTHTYTVSDSRFEVVGNSLNLKSGISLDHETEPSVNIQVTSTDQGNLARTETFTINVSDANEAPTSISLSANAVNENAPGAVIGSLSGTDVDLGDNLTFSIADTSSPFEVAGDVLKLKDGVSLDFEQDSEVSVTVTATDSKGATLDRGFTITVHDGFESLAIDGYIAGATVFADANNNGVFDPGEATTTTDAFGNFTLFGGSGQLIMSGGVDISTSHAFGGIMRAPEGSTVVTPLTTLVVAIAEATGSDIATATGNLLAGLGLPAGLDLSAFDPIAAAVSSDPVAQAQGSAAIAAAVQIQNTIVQAASLLDGAGATFADAASSVVTQLATAINAQGSNAQTIDLNSGTAIQSIIENAAVNTAGVNAATVANTAAGAASVISSSNAVIDAAATGGQTGADLLTTLAQVAIVANNAASALVDAGAGTQDINNVQGDFTGSNLSNAVDAAESEVGNVAGVNGNDTIVGTENSDLLQGFGGNDTLSGLGGNDVLDGGDGDDFLDGGAGRDRATYVTATGAITVDLAAGTVSGAGVGSDTLYSIEQVRGSNFDDHFDATGFGSTSTNASSVGANNLFEGMDGDDTITGNGSTVVSYLNAAAGVTVDLGLGMGHGTAAGDSANVGTDTFTGVNNVVGSRFADVLTGSNSTAGIEQFTGGAGDDLINGLGGNDRAVYFSLFNDSVTGGITINLASGTVTGDLSVGTDTLRSIESIRGTSFADSYDATGFSGTSVNAGSNGTFNEFEGMGSNDTILGNGNTRIAFYNATAAVTVDLAAGTVHGDASVGDDTINLNGGILINGFTGGVSAIVGSQFDDTFRGSTNAANTSEIFEGRAGDDLIDGRGGFDQALYSNDTAVTAGISVNMAAGIVTGNATIGVDTLRSVESVRGTSFDDTYDATGWATAGALNIGDVGTIGSFGGSLNEFEGGAGNDTITGSGDTRISFANSSGSVTVDLAAGTATGNGSVGTDTITGGVARVRGSNSSDTISGDSLANNLDGQGGNDRLDGRGGADTLTGGAGADTFVFANGNGIDNITDFTHGQDKIDLVGIGGILNFSDVQAIAVVSGSGTILKFNGFTDDVFLANIAPGSLQASDFIFGHAPTDIALSNSSVAENSANGTVVGVLSATDADAGDTATFTLLDNAGGRFAVSGTNLVVAGALDYEAATSHQVTVRVTDTAGHSYTEIMTVGVTNVSGNVVGTPGDDNLVGTSEEDTIQGLDGNDRLQGFAGNDLLIGGDGRDRAVYSDATGAITVDLAAGIVTGAGVGTDTLRSIEQITGTNFADTFVASGFGSDSTNASSDGITNNLEGLGGDDTFTGNGNTQVSYKSALAGVTVTLGAGGTGHGTASGDAANVGTDTFISGVTGVRGSEFADVLTGSNNTSGFEQFTGGAGNDTINGLGGNDRALYFGVVDDTVTAGVTINMKDGIVTGDASVGVDTLRSVEGVRGSSFADSYDATGFGVAGSLNVNNNTFNEFEGMGGDDTIQGNGNTRISFLQSTNGVTVDLQNGTATGGALVGSDHFANLNLVLGFVGGVNAIVGSQFDDTLLGSNNTTSTNAEQFDGRAGDDLIDGRGGNDLALYNNDANVTAGISVDMASGDVFGDASIGHDTLRSIEFVRATNFDDIYVATGFNGTTSANLGSNGTFNDFEGMGGNDTITGNGNTRLSYTNATSAVIVNLALGVADGASTGHDTITGGINAVRGSSSDDIIRGTTGNDTLDGQGGVNDFVSYLGASGGVTVNLATNTATGADGSDTLSNFESIAGSNFNDTLTGNNGNNVLQGNGGADALNGGNGIDTADYSNAVGGLTADLGTPGNNTGDALGDSYTLIEGLRGSDNGADILRGDGNTNFLEGGHGAFADVLDGAGGVDYASYASSTVGVTASLGNPVINTGDAAGDTYTSIEGLVGSNFNDHLTGDGGTNFFRGGAGADVFDGGLGSDTVEYINSTVGITVSLADPTQNTGEAAGDTYVSIENLTGSNNNDNLFGDNNDNVIAGKTGADNLHGGGGNDTADYSTAPAAVIADLLTPGINTGDAAGDTYDSIENLRGSNNNDTLSGDGNSNFLDGAGGNDILDGRGGADVLFGSGGTDTFVFSAGEANGDTISDFFAPPDPAVGDALVFHGFGTAVGGATFTFIGAGQWQIHSGLDAHNEVITLTGSIAATVQSNDYLFSA